MKFTLRGRHEGRVRKFTFVSGNHQTAPSDANHLLLNFLRVQKGYTGEVWRNGEIELLDHKWRSVEIQVTPHLELIESPQQDL